VLAGPGCRGPDTVMRRAMTTVDEASLSAAALNGVVVPAWRGRGAGEGAGEGESEGESEMVHA
jgi:hypothetical protein